LINTSYDSRQKTQEIKNLDAEIPRGFKSAWSPGKASTQKTEGQKTVTHATKK